MQPYFLPYIGYFQLINAVDLFIVYDNIQYTKKGWINRNRMLQNGQEVVFSLPLKSGSDYLDVCQRELSADFNPTKFLNQFREAYRKAPYFAQTFPLLEQIVRYEDANLFRFLHNSITRTCEYLKIDTRMSISSDIQIDHALKGQDKVLALCRQVGANTYVNPVGGIELYSKAVFRENGIELSFIKAKPFEYPQFGGRFVPWLSIVDVMMFNPVEAIRECLSTNFEMV